jgi:murein DD-endopeptidase MepM/ murein hydrolase activator NlpD
MSVRKAEVLYLGDADSLIRASGQGVEANKRFASSAAAAADAAAKAAAKTGASYEAQAKAAGDAARRQAEAVGASAKQQEAASAKAADAARAAAIRTDAAASSTGHSYKNLALGVGIAGAAIVAGIKKSADTTEELTKSTLTLSHATGLNSKTAGTYAAIAQTQGLSVKSLDMAFGTLSKGIHAVEIAHTGGAKAAGKQEQALRELGLPLSAITKAHGDLNKLLPQIIQKFVEMPGGVARTSAAMTLFARGWQTLVPLMHSGALGIQEQEKLAKKLGDMLGGQTKKGQEEFIVAQEESKYSSLELQVAVGKYLAPELTKLIHTETEVVHALGEGVQWLQKHEAAAITLGAAVGALGLGAAFLFTANKVKSLVKVTREVAGGFGTLASKVKGSGKEIESSMGGAAKATEASAVEMAAAEGKMVKSTAAADTKIATENKAAGASFLKMLGPIAAVAFAIEGLEGPAEQVWKALNGEEGPHGFQQFGKNLTSGGLKQTLEGAARKGARTKDGRPAFINPAGELLSAGAGAQKLGKKGHLEALWVEADGDPSEAPMAAAIAMAESGGNARAINHNTNGTIDRGLWQINSIHGSQSTLDERRNARAAVEISNDGKEWGPWVTYKKGAEKQFLGPSVLKTAHHGASGNLGYYEPPAKKAKKPKAEAYVDPFGGANVQRTREDMGIDFVAHPGQAIGAIGAGVIDKIIKNWYKGQPLIEERLTSGPNKGQYVYYAEQINPNVREGQKVKAGQRIGTVAASGTGLEFGFGAGGGRTLAQARHEFKDHAGNDPTAASKAYAKFLASIGKTGSNLELGGQAFEKAMKRAEHLILTAAQKANLHMNVAAAGHDHAEAELYEGKSGEAGSHLEEQQKRWARPSERADLTTAGGQATAKARDEAPIFAALAQKKYLERAVRALKKEAAEWAKLRKKYLKIAREQLGKGGKKKAIERAAYYAGKIKQAEKEAAELGGSIHIAEEAIEEGNLALAALPGEIATSEGEQQSTDMGAYEHAISHSELEEYAGVITPAEGKVKKEEAAKKAQAGGFGPLSPDDLLKVGGDLKGFGQALESATSATEAHTEATLANTKAILEREQAARQLEKVTNSTLITAVADLISGQIGGKPQAYHSISGPAFDSAARY